MTREKTEKMPHLGAGPPGGRHEAWGEKAPEGTVVDLEPTAPPPSISVHLDRPQAKCSVAVSEKDRNQMRRPDPPGERGGKLPMDEGDALVHEDKSENSGEMLSRQMKNGTTTTDGVTTPADLPLPEEKEEENLSCADADVDNAEEKKSGTGDGGTECDESEKPRGGDVPKAGDTADLGCAGREGTVADEDVASSKKCSESKTVGEGKSASGTADASMDVADTNVQPLRSADQRAARQSLKPSDGKSIAASPVKVSTTAQPDVATAAASTASVSGAVSDGATPRLLTFSPGDRANVAGVASCTVISGIIPIGLFAGKIMVLYDNYRIDYVWPFLLRGEAPARLTDAISVRDAVMGGVHAGNSTGEAPRTQNMGALASAKGANPDSSDNRIEDSAAKESPAAASPGTKDTAISRGKLPMVSVTKDVASGHVSSGKSSEEKSEKDILTKVAPTTEPNGSNAPSTIVLESAATVDWTTNQSQTFAPGDRANVAGFANCTVISDIIRKGPYSGRMKALYDDGKMDQVCPEMLRGEDPTQRTSTRPAIEEAPHGVKKDAVAEVGTGGSKRIAPPSKKRRAVAKKKRAHATKGANEAGSSDATAASTARSSPWTAASQILLTRPEGMDPTVWAGRVVKVLEWRRAKTAAKAAAAAEKEAEDVLFALTGGSAEAHSPKGNAKSENSAKSGAVWLPSTDSAIAEALENNPAAALRLINPAAALRLMRYLNETATPKVVQPPQEPPNPPKAPEAPVAVPPQRGKRDRPGGALLPRPSKKSTLVLQSARGKAGLKSSGPSKRDPFQNVPTRKVGSGEHTYFLFADDGTSVHDELSKIDDLIARRDRGWLVRFRDLMRYKTQSFLDLAPELWIDAAVKLEGDKKEECWRRPDHPRNKMAVQIRDGGGSPHGEEDDNENGGVTDDGDLNQNLDEKRGSLPLKDCNTEANSSCLSGDECPPDTTRAEHSSLGPMKSTLLQIPLKRKGRRRKHTPVHFIAPQEGKDEDWRQLRLGSPKSCLYQYWRGLQSYSSNNRDVILHRFDGNKEGIDQGTDGSRSTSTIWDKATLKELRAKVAFLNSLGFVWWKNNAEQGLSVPVEWWRNLLSLKDFVLLRGGDSAVPLDSHLGRWCAVQRLSFQTKELTSTQVDALVGIGFNFSIDEDEVDWNKCFFRFFTYRKKKGDGIVPMYDFGAKNDDGEAALRRFAMRQRIERKIFDNEPSKSYLTLERIEALEELDFCWKIDKGISIDFLEKFRQLRRIVETHGSSRKGFKIGFKECPAARNFARITRDRHKGTTCYKWGFSLLTPMQIELLDSIGFEWFVPDNFDDMVELLREYKKENGHVKVPFGHPELWRFVSQQRMKYDNRLTGKPNGLSDSRVQLLNDLGFCWRVKAKRNPANKYERVGIERPKRKRDEQMAEEAKIPREQMIGWDLQARTPRGKHSTVTFEEWFDCLREYKERYGHVLVPQVQPGLGLWVKKLRHQYERIQKNKGSSYLTEDRMKRLQDLGFHFRLRKSTPGIRLRKKRSAEDQEPVNAAPENEEICVTGDSKEEDDHVEQDASNMVTTNDRNLISAHDCSNRNVEDSHDGAGIPAPSNPVVGDERDYIKKRQAFHCQNEEMYDEHDGFQNNSVPTANLLGELLKYGHSQQANNYHQHQGSSTAADTTVDQRNFHNLTSAYGQQSSTDFHDC